MITYKTAYQSNDKLDKNKKKTFINGFNKNLFLISIIITLLLNSSVLVEASNSSTTQRNLILVGDSRTNNMKNWVDTSISTSFIAKAGEGYQWFMEEGIDRVNSMKQPGDVIIVWLGVNDYFSNDYGEETWTLYADTINSLAENEWSDCKVYVASVGYVDRARNIAYYRKDKRSNVTRLSNYLQIKGIREFNKNLNASLSKKVTWLCTYKVIGIKNTDYSQTPASMWVTRANGKTDGLHYGISKTQEIYDYFVEKTMS